MRKKFSDLVTKMQGNWVSICALVVVSLIIVALGLHGNIAKSISLQCYDSRSWNEYPEGTTLSADTNYRFGLTIPDELLPDGLKVRVDVDYPEEVKSEENGRININVRDEYGHIWRGHYNFVADEDLSFVHGENMICDNRIIIIGDGIWDVGSFDRGVIIELYTSAKEAENYDAAIRDNFAARTGACLTTKVYFHQK